jgi:hypothetical protein
MIVIPARVAPTAKVARRAPTNPRRDQSAHVRQSAPGGMTAAGRHTAALIASAATTGQQRIVIGASDLSHAPSHAQSHGL